MTTSIECPIDAEALADYFAGALEPAVEGALEDHVFECAGCAARWDAAGAIAEGLRALVPPVVSHAWFERELARGTPLRRLEVRSGEPITAEFAHGLTYLIFVLKAELTAGDEVALEVSPVDAPPYAAIEDVPYDAARGEVLIACQRHYMEDFPLELVFRVVAGRDEARRVVGEYRVTHVVPPPL